MDINRVKRVLDTEIIKYSTLLPSIRAKLKNIAIGRSKKHPIIAKNKYG